MSQSKNYTYIKSSIANTIAKNPYTQVISIPLKMQFGKKSISTQEYWSKLQNARFRKIKIGVGKSSIIFFSKIIHISDEAFSIKKMIEIFAIQEGNEPKKKCFIVPFGADFTVAMAGNFLRNYRAYQNFITKREIEVEAIEEEVQVLEKKATNLKEDLEKYQRLLMEKSEIIKGLGSANFGLSDVGLAYSIEMSGLQYNLIKSIGIQPDKNEIFQNSNALSSQILNFYNPILFGKYNPITEFVFRGITEKEEQLLKGNINKLEESKKNLQKKIQGIGEAAKKWISEQANVLKQESREIKEKLKDISEKGDEKHDELNEQLQSYQEALNDVNKELSLLKTELYYGINKTYYLASNPKQIKYFAYEKLIEITERKKGVDKEDKIFMSFVVNVAQIMMLQNEDIDQNNAINKAIRFVSSIKEKTDTLEIEALAYLVALLVREKDDNLNIKEFDADAIHRKAKFFMNLPYGIAMSVKAFFLSLQSKS